MNAPLVSISSAIYNTGPALLDMVRSVFAQTSARGVSRPSLRSRTSGVLPTSSRMSSKSMAGGR